MIVFGYDGSDGARRAMLAASELLSGPALVVHVWDTVPAGAAPALATPGMPGAGLPMLANAEKELEQRACDVLDEGVRHATEAGFDVQPVLVAGGGGTPWRDVLEVAERRRARVIVVGRRGVSRVRSALLGSVSNGIVQHAHVPVLVVPPPSEDSPRASG